MIIKHWDDAPDIMNADELASLLGINKYLVYQKARSGEFPTVPGLGRLTRFSKSRMRSFLDGDDSLKNEESSPKANDSERKEVRWL